MTEQQNKRIIKAKRALFDKYYDFLNDEQRKAVFTVNGPVLILAGAGSGKTTVLVNRISHILKFGNAYYSESIPDCITEDVIEDLEGAVSCPKEIIEKYLELFETNTPQPWGILAITFTNKAAGEIKERLEKTVGEGAGSIWAGTFHSVCMKILRVHGELVGYHQGFSVCDTDDCKKVISKCLKELTITAEGDRIRCECGLDATLDSTYRLHNAPFESINEWFEWQQASIDTDTEVLSTKARLGCCGADGFMDPEAGEGEVYIDKNEFRLSGTLHGEPIEFSIPTEKIGAFPTTPGDHFDIYHNGRLIYVYPLPDLRASAKWVCYLDKFNAKKA